MSCRATDGKTAGRVVAPLVLASEVGYRDTTLNPEFTIDGATVILNPLQMATIPTRALGPVVGSLDGEHIRVIAALDAMIAQGRQQRSADGRSPPPAASLALKPR